MASHWSRVGSVIYIVVLRRIYVVRRCYCEERLSFPIPLVHERPFQEESAVLRYLVPAFIRQFCREFILRRTINPRIQHAVLVSPDAALPRELTHSNELLHGSPLTSASSADFYLARLAFSITRATIFFAS